MLNTNIKTLDGKGIKELGVYFHAIPPKFIHAYKWAITHIAPPFNADEIQKLIETLDLIEGDSDFEFEHDDLGIPEGE